MINKQEETDGFPKRISEANRQDCPFCFTTPCSCTEEETDERLYHESMIYSFGDEE